MKISDIIKFYEDLSLQTNIKKNCNSLTNNKIDTRTHRLEATGIKVINTPIKLNDEANDKNTLSANKIRFHFRVHLKKLDNMRNNGIYTNNRFIKTTYNGNDKSICGREYYFHEEHRPVYRPNEKTSHGGEGGFKKITHKDSRFIALEPIDIAERFHTENNFNDIKEIDSIKVGLAVSTKLIIARNAGVDIFSYIENGDTIPYSAFKNAVMDLKKLHCKNVYLRDIKPENTTYDNKNVNFIDVEDRISAHVDSYNNRIKWTISGEPVIYTENYITSELKEHIYSEYDVPLTGKNVIKYLKSADEYAFLLTTIAATTENSKLKSIILNDDENQYQDRTTGKMRVENKNEFNQWINEKIKVEHRGSARLLLTNPKLHAELKGDIYLSDMFLLPKK